MAAGGGARLKRRQSADYLFWAVKVKDLPTLTKLILVTLADMADANGRCHPGHQHIANMCGCSRRSVIRHLETLAELRLIRIEHRSEGGRKTSNVYALPDVTQSHNDVTLCHRGDDTVALGGSDTVAHKTPTLLIHPNKHRSGVPKSTKSTTLADDLADTSWAS